MVFSFFFQYFIWQCHLLMAMPINVDVVVVDFAAEKDKKSQLRPQAAQAQYESACGCVTLN